MRHRGFAYWVVLMVVVLAFVVIPITGMVCCGNEVESVSVAMAGLRVIFWWGLVCFAIGGLFYLSFGGRKEGADGLH